MKHRRAAVPPPAIPGVESPCWRDAFVIAWWTQRGFLHGARRGSTSSLVLLILWWLLAILLYPVQAVMSRSRRRTRYYLAPSRDAVLAVAATRRGWHIADHQSRRPGAGQGRSLRELLKPHLLAAADEAGVCIRTTAATTTLAAIYTRELPGLDVMSREVGQPGDGWLASGRGVGSVVIVEVEPAGQGGVALLG